MKKIILLLVMFCTVPLLSEITKEGDGAVKLDRETRALSFQLLLKEKLTHFAADDFPAGKAKITEAMRRDPVQYARRAVACQQAKKLFYAELQSVLRHEVGEIVNSTVGELNAKEQAALDAMLRTLTEQKMKALFPAAFNAVRDQLAEEERNSQIYTAIYPSGKELEMFDDANLTVVLLRRFTADDRRPIMEENCPFVQKNLVAPVIAAGRKQQRIQAELLPHIRIPQELWQADEVERFLQNELRAETARELSDAKAHFMEFPSVQSRLQQRAQNVICERLAAAMPEALETAVYRQLLEKEPELHVNWQLSAGRCCKTIFQDTLERAMTAIRIPTDLRAKVLPSDAAMQKIFTDAAMVKFRAVRGDYADRQFKRVWADFDEWLPRMEETEFFIQGGEKDLPAVTGQPECAETLFAETRVKIADAMRKKFTDEAARLKAQQKCVDAIYREVADECNALDRSYRTQDPSFWQRLFGIAPDAVTLAKIIEVYEKRIGLMTSKPLFPATRRDVEIRARAILQQLQEDAAKLKISTAEHRKSPQTFTLSVSGQEDTEIILQMGQWQKRFSDGNSPADAIAAELKRQQGDRDAPVILMMEVTNPALTYRRVAELREALQKLLPDAMIRDHYRK